jgi:hypothetical protein
MVMDEAYRRAAERAKQDEKTAAAVKWAKELPKQQPKKS